MMANYAFGLPESLMDYVKKLSSDERVSVNQFFVTAIAEKVSALKTEEYFKQRRERANLDGFDSWLDAAPKTHLVPGDAIKS